MLGLEGTDVICPWDLISPFSRRLIYPQLLLPQRFAIIPDGIPPVASLRPTPIPRSPLTITADFDKFVGAGGLARVDGARLLTV